MTCSPKFTINPEYWEPLTLEYGVLPSVPVLNLVRQKAANGMTQVITFESRGTGFSARSARWLQMDRTPPATTCTLVSRVRNTTSQAVFSLIFVAKAFTLLSLSVVNTTLL
jgi:hypothetical protein